MRRIIYITGIILLLFGGHYMFKETKVKNVFDEMYYAEIQSAPSLYTSTSFINLINKKVLKSLSLNMRNESPNLKREIYRDEALNKHEKISLFYYLEEKKVEIIGILNVNEQAGEALRFSYTYNIDDKKMKVDKIELSMVSSNPTTKDYHTSNPEEISEFIQMNDLTEEDLADYQDYFLYEKVLADWFAHNPKSRFSLDDLGDVEIVETDVYEE